jgi:hypothetical protein
LLGRENDGTDNDPTVAPLRPPKLGALNVLVVLSDEERSRMVAAITRDSADVVQTHTGDAGFAYQITATVVTAVG